MRSGARCKSAQDDDFPAGGLIVDGQAHEVDTTSYGKAALVAPVPGELSIAGGMQYSTEVPYASARHVEHVE